MKRGDVVEVVTTNRGLSPSLWRRLLDKQESWTGEIVGPSVLGPAWWMVRRLGPAKYGRTYAVPSDEIKRRVRK